MRVPSDTTAMEFAPDGRLFVAQQSGKLRVVQNGTLLATPFLTVAVNSSGERGLLGVAFDPNFATNHFVYVYYTATTPTIHNRVSRFTANGNVAVAGSQVVLLNLNTLSSATNHNGGALHFGNDGKLYVAVGDNAKGSNAQTRDEPARQDPAPESRRHDSGGQSLLRAAKRREPRDLGDWDCAIHLRPRSSAALVGSSSMTWAKQDGRKSTQGVRGANYGWPIAEGAIGRSTLQGSRSSPTGTVVVSARSPAVHSTNPTRFRHSIGASTFSPISARAGSGG